MSGFPMRLECHPIGDARLLQLQSHWRRQSRIISQVPHERDHSGQSVRNSMLSAVSTTTPAVAGCLLRISLICQRVGRSGQFGIESEVRRMSVLV